MDGKKGYIPPKMVPVYKCKRCHEIVIDDDHHGFHVCETTDFGASLKVGFLDKIGYDYIYEG